MTFLKSFVGKWIIGKLLNIIIHKLELFADDIYKISLQVLVDVENMSEFYFDGKGLKTDKIKTINELYGYNLNMIDFANIRDEKGIGKWKMASKIIYAETQKQGKKATKKQINYYIEKGLNRIGL